MTTEQTAPKADGYREEAVIGVGCVLAMHPVLSLLALQEDATDAEALIRDCSEKVISRLIKMGWRPSAVSPEATEKGRDDAHD
jgi:hypothetical protein